MFFAWVFWFVVRFGVAYVLVVYCVRLLIGLASTLVCVYLLVLFCCVACWALMLRSCFFLFVDLCPVFTPGLACALRF